MSLLSRRPSLSRKREASVALESETMEVENMNHPRERVLLIAKMEQYLEKKREYPSGNQRVESISCLDQKMQMSALRLSQKSRGVKEAVASSYCSRRLEAKEQFEALKWLMQARFVAAAREGRRREEASAARRELRRRRQGRRQT